MKKTFRFLSIHFCLFTFAFCLSAFSQTLTVRDIMRDPSLAGMRPDSERLSPDGQLVAFAWNSEGKEPRNLYLVPTSGGAARIVVDAEKNYETRTAAPESKLNYGLIVRDDFARAREKNLGGAEFSPNSKRLLFTQNGDIYVLDLSAASNQDNTAAVDSRWRHYESNIIRRADLIPNMVRVAQLRKIQEEKFFGEIADARSVLLNVIHSSESKTAEQRQAVLTANEKFDSLISRLLLLQENYPQLRSNDAWLKIQDELQGTENRITVARSDYNDAIKNFNPQPRRITRTQGAEFAARWLDDSTILYQSGGNFFALDIERTFLVQITREANPQTFVSISFAQPTEDAQLLAYVVSDGSRQRALIVPNYLDEFTAAPTFRRGFTEQKVFVTKIDGSLERPFEVKLPKAEGASYLRNIRWAADQRSLIVDRVDKDTKRRQLFYVRNVGDKAEQTILLTDESDPKWIGSLSRLVEPHPKDAAQVLFASERNGFNHLYLATLEANSTGANVRQLTGGAFEIEWARWQKNGERIVYSSTEKKHGDARVLLL